MYIIFTERMEAEVVECACVIGLSDLKVYLAILFFEYIHVFFYLFRFGMPIV